MAGTLEIEGYYDAPLWGTVIDENGIKKRVLAMPITRYSNILGRPRAVVNVANAGLMDFALMKAKVTDINDEEVYNRANQAW